jgi:hypothetical protein
VWEAIDPDGVRVVLEPGRWLHVADKHRELQTTPEELLGVVAAPSERIPGRRPGEVWFYGRGGPTRWIKVVVHYERGRGRVMTAFPRRWFP